MSEENKWVLIYMGNDGMFREYDQRNDIIIHCDSEEDRKHLMNKLERVLNSGWIPCSERLPDKPEHGENGYIVQKKRVAEPFSAYWDGERWTNEDDDVIDEVIAWMPLPEPYKGE